MLRWLYIQLIWRHPAPFRWRFGDDMLDDFERAPKRAQLRYLADAVVSLARQWLIRPEFVRAEPPPSATVLLFQTFDTYKPRPAALLQGGLLAIFTILAPVLLIGKGGGMARPFLIGAPFSRASVLHINRNSVPGSDLNTTVQVGPDPVNPWLKLAQSYFATMPVLLVLDTDHDLTLSPWEIRNAPAALRRLDLHHPGKLTVEEFGLNLDPKSGPPDILAQIRRQFMSYHPVLAALDIGHTGELSAWEIDHAAAALKKLDRNHDGYLTPNELVPFDMAVHAGLR